MSQPFLRPCVQGIHGRTLNFVRFKAAVNKLDSWYNARGIMGQVRLPLLI